MNETKHAVRLWLFAALTLLMMIAIFTGNNLMMLIFIPLFVVLLISFFVARRADKQNAPIEPQDNPDAIFKEHEI